MFRKFMIERCLHGLRVVLDIEEASWAAAKNTCNVPSVGEILYATNRAYTKLPEKFTAWTSSTGRTSDWTSFHGCLDVTVNNVPIEGLKPKLNEYFPYSPNATTFKSVFVCAYFCTGKTDVFTFVRHICKCIYQNELKLDLVMQPVCITPNFKNRDNVDGVYSISHSSLPIFKFETGFRKMSKQKDGTERYKHHCLARSINETLTDSDCRSTKNYYCVGGANGNGIWSYAINKCLDKNALLSIDRSDYQDYWLSYFMYEEYEEDEQCVAIQRNNISVSLTKKFRPCSEHLPVLCNDEQNSVKTSTPVFGNHGSQLSKTSTKSTSDRSFGTISTNISNNQKPGENNVTLDLCIKIAAGGTTSFAVITILLLVIIFIQRRKLTKASYATLTVRRDQNNYNEVPHEMSDSITGQYYEVSPLSEIPAPGCQITAQQNIDVIQHIDTSGYLIPSGMLETDGDYQTITD
ncbi:unnamed protein product [Mytilus edulis]|uniref:Uncharacterized protein n=1 Tax=Mytilus edulis TaxID=6550 RepID=A0A8S3PS43_MYTED|nr:unnamed protein product [Mytilus edulis]